MMRKLRAAAAASAIANCHYNERHDARAEARRHSQDVHPRQPGEQSIHEEATVFAIGPMMGVFNNLVMFDQHVKQNRLESIIPDLATGWSWNEEGTTLTFALHQGVKWHDGKPFTARDVQCTWDLLMECRRKVEMSPVAQSRNDTLVGAGHDEHDLDCIPAVKVEQRI